MPAFLRVDGEAVESATAAFVTDRALAYGDGVFRTVRVRDGRVAAWALHRAKLCEDAARLGLVAAPSALERLERDMADLAARHPQAVGRITLTAGSGPRGYRRAPGTPTRILLQADPVDALHDDPSLPYAVRVCATRLAFQPRLAGIKHLNRLEQVLARAEWDDPAVGEGLMLDAEDGLVCGTMSNVFLLEDERLVTPALDRCGVAGVQRQRVLDWASRQGMPTRVERIPRARLRTARGLLLTNSVIGVRWVDRVDDAALTGRPDFFLALATWLLGD
jgi:4-amino-4-deoxychorismate lyase